MYKCNECGHIFEMGEEKRWTESYGEEFAGCPLCMGEFTEVYSCEICGAPTEGKFCGKCKDDVQARFIKLIENEFTTEERELLNELYDGEEI